MRAYTLTYAYACLCRVCLTHVYTHIRVSLTSSCLVVNQRLKRKAKEKGISITKLYIYPKRKRKENTYCLLLNAYLIHTKKDRKICSPPRVVKIQSNIKPGPIFVPHVCRVW